MTEIHHKIVIEKSMLKVLSVAGLIEAQHAVFSNSNQLRAILFVSSQNANEPRHVIPNNVAF